MRPSALGPVKRKCEMDDYEPNPKKWGLLITNNRLVDFIYRHKSKPQSSHLSSQLLHMHGTLVESIY